MSKKKSQASVEFLILVSAFVLFFAIFFIAIHENMNDELAEQNNLLVKEVALAVQDEINLALASDDGYFRTFAIPEKINNNKEYSISLTAGVVYLQTDSKKHAIALPVANVTGQIVKGENTIKKENGKIYLNA